MKSLYFPSLILAVLALIAFTLNRGADRYETEHGQLLKVESEIRAALLHNRDARDTEMQREIDAIIEENVDHQSLHENVEGLVSQRSLSLAKDIVVMMKDKVWAVEFGSIACKLNIVLWEFVIKDGLTVENQTYQDTIYLTRMALPYLEDNTELRSSLDSLLERVVMK